MDTDFHRDKKKIIFICITILLITILSISVIFYFSSTNKSQSIEPQRLTTEQKAARDKKANEINRLLNQLDNPQITEAERKEVLKKIDEIKTSE